MGEFRYHNKAWLTSSVVLVVDIAIKRDEMGIATAIDNISLKHQCFNSIIMYAKKLLFNPR